MQVQQTESPKSKMSYKLHFILTFWCALAISKIEGDEESELDVLLPSCKAILNKLIKEHVKIYSDCVKELKSTITDSTEAAKLTCAIKCTLNKSELLDSENKVTRDTLQGFMDKRVPALYHDMGHEVTAHCLTEFAGPDVNLNDEYCTVYGKVVECLKHVVTEACF